MSEKYLRVTMPDGSRWDVPVSTIAFDRAKHYENEFDGNLARSLMEDTVPLFEKYEAAVVDWASNDMNWDDVKDVAVRVTEPVEFDWEEGWANGEKEIVER